MKNVEICKKKRVFDDFFKIDQAMVRFEKFDKEMSQPVRRLNFERGDAVAVLVYNKETRRVILINQFRYPTYEKTGGWITEIPAGMLGKDEKPEECARREILEEIGYQVKKLIPISTFYTTPGGSSERVFLYYTEVCNSDKISKGGGLDSEHEDILIIEYRLEDLWKQLEESKIIDGKTLVALFWLRNLLMNSSSERGE